MSKVYKRVINLVAVFVFVFAFNMVAMAQGTTTISVSKNSAAVGDSIKVSVSGTEKGTITVKYTASMLNLASCSASGYSAEGNSISFSGTEADIVFTAASEGTASIIVSSSANSGSSTTLKVGDTASASASTNTSTQTTDTTETQTEPTEETAETTEEETTTEETPAAPAATAGATGTLNADGGFDINGVAYVVSERYSESEMPSGFSKTTVKIGSSTYSEPSNGTITLLYLKPADNTAGSGVFYLYNAEAGTVSPFLMLGSSKNYVIISDVGEALSAAFTATSLEVTGGTATAYTIDGSQFFYVYGTNQDGASGWFVYDSTYKTVSRVDESALSSASSTTDAADDEIGADNTNTDLYVQKLNLYRKIIMGLIVLCVILLFVIINRAIRGNGDDDDDFDGDVFAKAPVKTSRKLPRSIVFSPRERGNVFDDDDEDEDEADEEKEFDDEEDEFYDEEDDESTSGFESDSYESRRASSLNMMDLNDL